MYLIKIDYCSTLNDGLAVLFQLHLFFHDLFSSSFDSFNFKLDFKNSFVISMKFFLRLFGTPLNLEQKQIIASPLNRRLNKQTQMSKKIYQREKIFSWEIKSKKKMFVCNRLSSKKREEKWRSDCKGHDCNYN